MVYDCMKYDAVFNADHQEERRTYELIASYYLDYGSPLESALFNDYFNSAPADEWEVKELLRYALNHVVYSSIVDEDKIAEDEELSGLLDE